MQSILVLFNADAAKERPVWVEALSLLLQDVAHLDLWLVPPTIPWSKLLDEVSARLAPAGKDAKPTLLVLPADLQSSGSNVPVGTGGVGVLKHLRLECDATQVALQPVVVTSEKPLAAWLRASVDNAILAGPGSMLLNQLQLRVIQTRMAEGQFTAFQNVAELQRETKPYLVNPLLMPDVKHLHLNRIGAGLLLSELPSGLERPPALEAEMAATIKHYYDLRRHDLGVKRHIALREEYALPAPAAGTTRDEFAALGRFAQGQSVILIDDNYSHGWATALRCLLAGPGQEPWQIEATTGEMSSEVLNKAAQATSVVCCGSRSAAESLLEYCRHGLEAAAQSLAREGVPFNLQQRSTPDVAERWRELLPFGAVLLDLRLSAAEERERDLRKLSGFEILRYVRQHFAWLPVIVFTASERAISAQTAVELGADGYWTKGVDSALDLVRLLTRCFQLSSASKWRVDLPTLALKLDAFRRQGRFIRRRFMQAAQEGGAGQYMWWHEVYSKHDQQTRDVLGLLDSLLDVLIRIRLETRPASLEEANLTKVALLQLRLLSERRVAYRFADDGTPGMLERLQAGWQREEELRCFAALTLRPRHGARRPDFALLTEFADYTLDELLVPEAELASWSTKLVTSEAARRERRDGTRR